MQILPIDKTNLEDCAYLYTTVFNQAPWNEDWSHQQAMSRLKFYYETPNFIGMLVTDDSNLLGFVLGNYEPYQNEKLYLLKEMCVHPDFQGKGIGTKLIKFLHEKLKESGISTVNLITTIDSEAESFYFKNDYYKSQRMGLYVARLNNT